MIQFTLSKDQNVKIPGLVRLLCLALQIFLLSRLSRQRGRLMWWACPSACLSVCLFVCLLVRLSPKWKNAIFSKTKQWSLSYGLYWQPIRSHTWAFQRTHYWTPKIQDGGDPPSWKSRCHFSALGGPIWIKKIRRLVHNDVDCGDMVKIVTKSRILMWRTFGRIQWHLIPEPRATLQCERIQSAILKIVFRRILFFVFLM